MVALTSSPINESYVEPSPYSWLRSRAPVPTSYAPACAPLYPFQEILENRTSRARGITGTCTEVVERKFAICIEIWQVELENCVWRVSFHKYAYVHGDPVNAIDPTGMFWQSLYLQVKSAAASFAGRQAAIASIETALEYALTSFVHSAFLAGDPDDDEAPIEFNGLRVFATNFVANVATGGLKGVYWIQKATEVAVRTIVDGYFGQPIAASLAINILSLAGSEALLKAGAKLANKLASRHSSWIWKSIESLGQNHEGTLIPINFILRTQSLVKIYVAPNATKHLAETVKNLTKRQLSPQLIKVTQQIELWSLEAAVNKATKNGVVYDTLMKVDGWELKFSRARTANGQPVLFHALRIE